MKMNQVTASVIFSLGIASASLSTWAVTPASALSLTAGGSTYEVVVENVSFDELSGRNDFAALVPWFGDQALASALATAASDVFIAESMPDFMGTKVSLGTPQGNFFGPGFAYAINSNGSVLSTTYRNTEGEGNFTADAFSPEESLPYAIVDLGLPPAPIPTPALLPGLVGMGLAAMRKRNQA